jgi:hypothetical protein
MTHKHQPLEKVEPNQPLEKVEPNFQPLEKVEPNFQPFKHKIHSRITIINYYGYFAQINL